MYHVYSDGPYQTGGRRVHVVVRPKEQTCSTGVPLYPRALIVVSRAYTLPRYIDDVTPHHKYCSRSEVLLLPGAGLEVHGLLAA